jgi:hypothetical protein
MTTEREVAARWMIANGYCQAPPGDLLAPKSRMRVRWSARVYHRS